MRNATSRTRSLVAVLGIAAILVAALIAVTLVTLPESPEILAPVTLAERVEADAPAGISQVPLLLPLLRGPPA